MNTPWTLMTALAALLYAGCSKYSIVIEAESTYVEVMEEAQEVEPREPDAIKVTFNELCLNLKPDVPFHEEMLTNAVRALAGKRISVSGVMWGGVEKPRGLERFILLRNRPAKFGPGGEPADHLMHVALRSGETIDFTAETIRVEGIFRIEPETGADGNTWSLYILDDATIPPVDSAAS
jgi:hypothetical protein